MNEDQKKIYDEILAKYEYGSNGIVFIDAPGGTGKTFLLNLISAKIKAKNKIAIAVASSGINDVLKNKKYK